MSALKPYEHYRPARVHWLGEIPAHWVEKRAKYFFREVDERSETGAEELLSVSHTTGVTPRSQKKVTMFQAESYVGHKLARPNDIVINTMWAWMSALGVSKDTGIVSSAYGVYRPLDSGEYVPEFLDYLLRIPPLRWEYICRSTGIRASRLRLYPDKFLDISIPYPPREEQELMVAYLRRWDVSLKRLLKQKRQLLALTAERLNVTTQGLVEDSRATKIRLENAADLIERPVERISSETYVPVGLYNRGRGMFHKPETLGSDLGDSSFFWIEEGDLVLSGQFAWEGAVALAGARDAGCIASHRYPILGGKEDVADSAFLFALFRTSFGKLLLDQHSRGAAGRNRPLNVRSLMKEKITLPPEGVQRTIRDLVGQEALLRGKFSAEYKAISDYRDRLITDIVTGKLDARDAKVLMLDDEAESGLEVAGFEEELENFETEDQELAVEDDDAE